MAYIGQSPSIGNFQVCDAISTVNGQAAYTMQVSSVNVVPETANHMIVSLNGIIQAPGSSYTVAGSTITFASNLVTGDVINFIHILGSVLDLGVPSDATVTNAKTNFTSTSSAAGLQIKGDGTTDGTLQLNCSQNSHGIKLASPAHSAGQSYTVKFPTGNITADKFLKVASISGSGTSAVGQLSFADAGGGGMDLLNVTTLGSAASEIIVDNVFSATYNVYKFYIYNLKTSAGATVIFQLRYGGSSGTNEGSDAYVGRNIYAYQSGISQQRNSQNTGFYLFDGWSDSGSSADYQTNAEMTLFDPFGTQTFPSLYADGLIFNNGGGYNEVQNTMRGWFTSKARAKTGFRLYPASGNLNEHTKILTFGMKLS